MNIFHYIRPDIKRDDVINTTILSISCAIFGFCVGHIVGYKKGKERMQAEALIIGYGETNNVGEFKWME